MPTFNRRKFLKASAFAGIGTMIGAERLLSAPSILTSSRTTLSTVAGELTFRPYFVQQGRGPHLLEWAYASDTNWDAFHSNISATKEGVKLSDTEGTGRFGINVRWNVEGFGYIFITADNAGEFYTLPPAGKTKQLNLNYELARSRVTRNGQRMLGHQKSGWRASRDIDGLVAISEGYLEDASTSIADPERCAIFSQKALLFAMRASELIELEKAGHDIRVAGYRPRFYFGCDARSMFDMHEDLFLDRFSALFNFATVTHVWKTNRVMEDFEPVEGKKQYAMRELMLRRLSEKGITVEGRPIFWFQKWVTPDWIKKKTYAELQKYVEKTTREVVGHYGDSMYAWEIVNEFHDWANEVQVTPEQAVELTKLACDVAKATAPRVHRLINNCCPYAEYVQMKQWSGQEAKYRQRTPLQFTRDLVDAGVDFTLIGQQMYFPYRDLQDIVMLIERYQPLHKPLHLSEIGAPGGPSEYSVKLGTVGFPREPYVWHRQWDEELQADWLEAVYTLAYSKPYVEGAHWFDFVDPEYFIDNGGLLRSREGEKKAAYDRLLALQLHWTKLHHKNP